MKDRKAFRIVVAETYSPESVARLREVGEVTILRSAAPQTLIDALPEADALLVRARAHVTARIIDAAPRLKVIGRASLTVDHIDLRAARRRDISVVYAPKAAVASSAEFALGLMLAMHRRIPFFDQQVREGMFAAVRTPSGRELGRLTIGLLGMDAVAERLGSIVTSSFGSRIIYHDPDGGSPEGLAAEPVDLDALLSDSDILSVHLRLQAQTRGFVNAERIRKMKPDAILVNISRGGVIDTVALAEALEKEFIGGAALDVFESEPLPARHPLRSAPNCILTPHVAGATLDAASGRFDVADDVVRVLRGERPMHLFAPSPE